MALPGFDADVAGARLGPDTEMRHAREGDPQRLTIDKAPARQPIEHHGAGLEQIIPQRQATVAHRRWILRQAQQTIDGAPDRCRLVSFEDDLVRRARLAIGQRPAQRGMEAECRRHDVPARVGHRGGHVEGAGLDPIGDFEPEPEGILPPGRLARLEPPRAMRGSRRDEDEARGAGKAVPPDLVVPVGHPDTIALRLADDGEQDRRPAIPDGGVAVPQQVQSAAILQAHQLRPLGGDLSAERRVRDRNDVGHISGASLG